MKIMKIYAIILTCAVALWLTGCQEEEIKVYDGENYIQFVKNPDVDSTTVAFLFSPGATELGSSLIVRMAGVGYPVETPYKIVVDRELSTAIEGTHFKLPEKTAFRPGAMRDTTVVTFYRVPEMKTTSFRLVLRLEANETFTPGQHLYRYQTLVVNDKISRPTWWERDGDIEWYYLGEYSDKKFEYFLESSGGVNLDGLPAHEIWMHCIEFKYWLEEQKRLNDGEPLRDENGYEITVPVIG
jgi:hypothetical protein